MPNRDGKKTLGFVVYVRTVTLQWLLPLHKVMEPLDGTRSENSIDMADNIDPKYSKG